MQCRTIIESVVDALSATVTIKIRPDFEAMRTLNQRDWQSQIIGVVTVTDWETVEVRRTAQGGLD